MMQFDACPDAGPCKEMPLVSEAAPMDEEKNYRAFSRKFISKLLCAHRKEIGNQRGKSRRRRRGQGHRISEAQANEGKPTHQPTHIPPARRRRDKRIGFALLTMMRNGKCALSESAQEEGACAKLLARFYLGQKGRSGQIWSNDSVENSVAERPRLYRNP